LLRASGVTFRTFTNHPRRVYKVDWIRVDIGIGIAPLEFANSTIDQVSTFNTAPTCLFDATLQGVNQVQQIGVRGRRALVVFTDGKDEVLSGEKCSVATVNDVITQANMRDSRVPIYAFGWQSPNSPQIAVDDLRKMATETSGAFAVNQTVTAVFADLQAALSAQRAAKTAR
jgi:hypothetical protein